jgi:hypothetical protein
MGRSTAAFYVAYFESLVLSVCGYLLITSTFGGLVDYSALQRWGVDTQLILLCVTVVLQLLVGGKVKTEDVGNGDKPDDDDKDDGKEKATNLLGGITASLANVYCSLCFSIFAVFIVLLAQSSATTAPVSEVLTKHDGAFWYFHPSDVLQEMCGNGVWKHTLFVMPNVSTGLGGFEVLLASYGECLNNKTKELVRGVCHSGQGCITDTGNLTSYFSDDVSLYIRSSTGDAVHLVFGASYAESHDVSLGHAIPILGAISFATILAFISVVLLVSCYTAYSSTGMGVYCPLFISRHSLIASNGMVVFGIPMMHQMYGNCRDPFNPSVVAEMIGMFFFLSFGLFADLLISAIIPDDTYHELIEIVWTIFIAAIPVVVSFTHSIEITVASILLFATTLLVLLVTNLEKLQDNVLGFIAKQINNVAAMPQKAEYTDPSEIVGFGKGMKNRALFDDTDWNVKFYNSKVPRSKDS